MELKQQYNSFIELSEDNPFLQNKMFEGIAHSVQNSNLSKFFGEPYAMVHIGQDLTEKVSFLFTREQHGFHYVLGSVILKKNNSSLSLAMEHLLGIKNSILPINEPIGIFQVVQGLQQRWVEKVQQKLFSHSKAKFNDLKAAQKYIILNILEEEQQANLITNKSLIYKNIDLIFEEEVQDLEVALMIARTSYLSLEEMKEWLCLPYDYVSSICLNDEISLYTSFWQEKNHIKKVNRLILNNSSEGQSIIGSLLY